MPVFQLSKVLRFPPCELAEPNGLLAVGGDLTPERLLLAYRQGIFPWYSDDTPILWWSPDPRLILFPAELKISHSLQRVIRKNLFQVTFNRAFGEVIRSCAEVPRREGEGTWITQEMIDAYCLLHRLGFAHSVESWQDGKLVGGLYGVALGRMFYGESMFSRATDASKIAFVHLVRQLERWQFGLIDCQMKTAHLASLGAREIPRAAFVQQLSRLIEYPHPPGRWQFEHDLVA